MDLLGRKHDYSTLENSLIQCSSTDVTFMDNALGNITYIFNHQLTFLQLCPQQRGLVTFSDSKYMKIEISADI